jgi:methylated-DNA-[protein]-cysteine S-methyltransferase
MVDLPVSWPVSWVKNANAFTQSPSEKLKQEVKYMKNVFFCNYPIGTIGIAEDNGALCRVFFSKEKALPGFVIAETPLIKKAAAQLGEYFEGRRKSFNLPLALRGTDFQIAVWEALQTIPAGETRSYKDVAALIGNPKAVRAVGMANNRNPIVIIVPCHRVIGSDGSLTGYGGGLLAKQFLLDLENGPDKPGRHTATKKNR